MSPSRSPLWEWPENKLQTIYKMMERRPRHTNHTHRHTNYSNTHKNKQIPARRVSQRVIPVVRCITTETSLPQFKWVTFKAFKLLSIVKIINNLTIFFSTGMNWYLKSERTITYKENTHKKDGNRATVLLLGTSCITFWGHLDSGQIISFEGRGDLSKKKREEGWIQGSFFASVNESSIVLPIHLKTCRLWIKCHGSDSPEPFTEGFKVNGSHNH